MFYGTAEQFKNIKLTKQNEIAMIAKDIEIVLESDCYRDTDDLAKELLGQAMYIVHELKGIEGLKETIEDEMDNY